MRRSFFFKNVFKICANHFAAGSWWSERLHGRVLSFENGPSPYCNLYQPLPLAVLLSPRHHSRQCTALPDYLQVGDDLGYRLLAYRLETTTCTPRGVAHSKINNPHSVKMKFQKMQIYANEVHIMLIYAYYLFKTSSTKFWEKSKLCKFIQIRYKLS